MNKTSLQQQKVCIRMEFTYTILKREFEIGKYTLTHLDGTKQNISGSTLKCIKKSLHKVRVTKLPSYLTTYQEISCGMRKNKNIKHTIFYFKKKKFQQIIFFLYFKFNSFKNHKCIFIVLSLLIQFNYSNLIIFKF